MPAYFIVDNEVTDPTGFEEYRKQVPGTVEKYGGEFLVRGGQMPADAGRREGRLQARRPLMKFGLILDTQFVAGVCSYVHP